MACDDVISSLVVEVRPESLEDVAVKLSVIEGVEVHEKHPGKLVVTVEAPTVGEAADIAGSFAGIGGVTGVSLVYVNCEGIYDQDE